ncbi:MAG: hypothetical protein ABI082_15010 [Dokdonella sp.]
MPEIPALFGRSGAGRDALPATARTFPDLPRMRHEWLPTRRMPGAPAGGIFPLSKTATGARTPMRSFTINSTFKMAALALATLLLAACFGGRTKPETVKSGDVPSSFDVTLIAAKDNQFDYEDAPLTEEDLKSALRYRQEESLPIATVVLKRGEKEKIKKEHIIALARVAYQMHFKAYMQEKDGQISQILARAKEPEQAPPEPKHPEEKTP